jgi:hypothetical protein
MTAWNAIVFARYMMLAPENRINRDERSMGKLFYSACNELSDITWIEATGYRETEYLARDRADAGEHLEFFIVGEALEDRQNIGRGNRPDVFITQAGQQVIVETATFLLSVAVFQYFFIVSVEPLKRDFPESFAFAIEGYAKTKLAI